MTLSQVEIDDDIFARPPRRVAPAWVAGRSITCRVHLLPSPANAQGLLLCQDCLDNLDSAAAHIEELRETTIDGWLTWLASQDDATIAWWQKMEALDPPMFKSKCMLALEKGGRGAAVVQAWRAKEDALGRCAAAEREIEGARNT